MSLLNQLPRFSALDMGSLGEGTLDPLGLSPGAERIAELLAPGLRARMVQPRFVTLAAIGAMARPQPDSLTTISGPSPDIAFEWLVAEALARDNPQSAAAHHFPGSRKVARALRRGDRVSASDYLASPRVFGFTGVYRPFSRYAGVSTSLDELGRNAVGLVEAWERDQGLRGYVSGTPGSDGARFRNEIGRYVRSAMEAGHVSAPASGHFLRRLAKSCAPAGAGPTERAFLRGILTNAQVGDGEVRDELVKLLADEPDADDASEQELAHRIAQRASLTTGRTLHAAIAYEDCASKLDFAFRSILRHGSAQYTSFDLVTAARAEGVVEIATEIPSLVDSAQQAIVELDNPLVTAAYPFAAFSEALSPAHFAEVLLAQHERVQADKSKLPWLDVQGEGWRVRRPFREQPVDQNPNVWLHPLRLRTIVNFLKATRP